VAPQRFDYQLKILGDSAELVKALGSATQALEKVRRETKANSDSFGKLAASAATAYASIKVALVDSVKGFFDAERATRQLEQALKQQGIFSQQTVQSYDALANGLSRLIGIDDDAAKAAFARGQALLGNIPITERLTQASADLAAGMKISFEDAFEKVTRAVGSSKNALKEYGITVEKGAEAQVKMEQALRGIEARFGGQANAARDGEVSIKALGVSVGNLQEKMGALLAPSIKQAADALSSLIDKLQQNQDFVKFATFVGTAAAAITGFVLVLNGGAAVVTAFRNAMAVLNVVMSANPWIAAAAAVAASYAIISKYEASLVAAGQAFQGIGVTVAEVVTGIGKVFKGFIFGSDEDIEAGIARIKNSVNRGIDAASEIYLKRKQEFQETHGGVTYGFEFGPPEPAKNDSTGAMGGVRSEEAEAAAKEAADRAEEWRQYEINQTRDAYERIEKQQKEHHTKKLQEEEKYRKQYGIISKILTKDEFTAFQEHSNQMALLAQSKNATLKGIGKAYALSNIAISTAEMATKAYSALAGIPLVGPILGKAAAIAAIAFGAERASDVLAANTGGFVPGSGPNRDSIDAKLTPGEFVTPRNTADEVINAVAAERSGTHASNEDVIAELRELREALALPARVKITSDGPNNFIPSLLEAMSYHLEHENGQLFGVTYGAGA
jgi:hypothetical protein